MIWIEYRIRLAGKMRSSILGFDRFHERDFDVLYHNVSHMIRKRALISLGQLAVYCGHYIAESLRSEGHVQEITEKVKSVRTYCRELDDAEQISFGVMIDSLPRRVFFVPLAR
ncbi:MAG: hypothetical protein D9C04_03325 [Nitrosopumilus sp. B06]|nr:MAG: hypothetical protein EB828_05115 [Nitrosopumilus sp. D6]RNJ79899.1 MAG: hypothetical protein D9C04_03325 [Nitrosopumilus sp. B06]